MCVMNTWVLDALSTHFCVFLGQTQLSDEQGGVCGSSAAILWPFNQKCIQLSDEEGISAYSWVFASLNLPEDKFVEVTTKQSGKKYTYV